MLESLITSKTRLQLLLRFFTNPNNTAHLRQLAADFGESTNAVRVELKRLVDAKLLTHASQGRKIVYQANAAHPLFPDITSIVRKSLGIDKLVEMVLGGLGNVYLALLIGDYARGTDTGLIDIIIVGDVDQEYLRQLIELAESRIHRRIRPLVLGWEEYQSMGDRWKKEERVVLWETEKVLLGSERRSCE
ncbi:ArsR family transcriptional regulator [Heliobacterium gestii]|uniref:ArsR family transcriptional regulator n=1 Tax=Heliomicrobium gestii TaxID=2699 RepID=A0A845LI46_HELGE|nr:winged helix-turn-helix domain-containing protein [Heliomicrobium gestii]MBM7866597.1 hypothetical protein [Heliomicrobium gestii]MZP43123.1 ArsR family transcriptional regulator [Heliomicrobium gestii]